MKRILIVILATGLSAIPLGAQAASAPAGPTEKDTGASFSLGGITGFTGESGSKEDFEAFALMLTARFDSRLGRNVMGAFEAMLIVNAPNYGTVIAPGYVLNLESRSLFFGAGLILPIVPGLAVEIPTPKFNVGIKAGRRIFTLYWITSFRALFNYNALGLSVGLRL